ncbi:hypothetical protein BCV72DRAFT_213193, partial [Rhizopus microsporus var. microsporus]
ISLKQASIYILERNSPRTVDLLHHRVAVWKAASIDFPKNCVFVDEAGFHSQMMIDRACSKAGGPGKVRVHNQKCIDISIIGCIITRDIIGFSKVEPLKKHEVVQLENEYRQDKRSSKKRKTEMLN